jgi:hypothetical protein
VAGSPQTASFTTSGLTTSTAPGVTLSFAELGLSQNYTFAGTGTSDSFTLPVPDALEPAALSGTIIVPPDFGTGTIVAQSGSVYVGSFQLPANSPNQQLLNFTVGLAGGTVLNQQETFSLSMQQAGGGVPGNEQSLTCGASILPVTLIKLSATYTGSFVPPSNLATFFPPVLQQVEIYVPSDPSLAVQQASLSIAASIARLFSLVPVVVRVESWDSATAPPDPTDPLSRAIWMHPGGAPGLQLADDAVHHLLTVSGDPAALRVQGDFFANTLSPLADGDHATVQGPLASPSVPLTEATFSQLGLSATSTFAGVQDLNVTFNSAQFGGVLSQLVVDLQASYTPIASNEKADLQVSVGGDVLDSQPLASSGTLYLPVTIPSNLISRYTTLTTTVDYFPDTFGCGGLTRTITFSIDPRSTVTATFHSGASAGFANLPASLQPSFLVSLAQPSPQELDAAVQLVCGVQRMTSVELYPRASSLSSSLSNGLPLVVVGRSASLSRDFSMPLRYLPGLRYSQPVAQRTKLLTGVGVGAIQAFAEPHNDRTVVAVTTSGPWSLTQRLFDSLGATSTAWDALTGNVLATGSSGQPSDLNLSSASSTLSSSKNSRLIELAVGLFVVIVAAILLFALLRMMRARRDSDPDDESDDGLGDDPRGGPGGGQPGGSRAWSQWRPREETREEQPEEPRESPREEPAAEPRDALPEDPRDERREQPTAERSSDVADNSDPVDPSWGQRPRWADPSNWVDPS